MTKKSIAKGLIWESLGVVMLFSYTWITTGSIEHAGMIGLVYPAIRAMMWPAYEKLFNVVRRHLKQRTENERFKQR